MNAIILQVKGDETSSLFSQVTDVESLSQTWKLCTKVASHLDQGERLENLSWRLFYLHSVITTGGMEGKKGTFRMLSKQTGQKIGRERHLRVSQLKSPPIKRVKDNSIKSSVVSSNDHCPTVVCGFSASMSTFGQNIATGYESFAAPLTNVNDLSSKNGSLNFESFLSSFSPLSLFSAINYLSSSSQPQIPFDESNAIIPMSESITDLPNFPQESQQRLDFLPPPRRLCGPESFVQQSIESSSPQSDNVGTELFPQAPSVNPIFNHWDFNGSVSTGAQTLGNEYMEGNGNQERPEESRQKIMPKGPLRDFGQSLLNQDPVTATRNFGGGERTFELKSAVTAKSSEDCGSSFLKVGEKRKRRNPMATRPPTFTGATEKAENPFPDGFSARAVCTNCQGTQTPLWRRGPKDELLCNACGVFYKVHKKNRPETLRKLRYSSGPSGTVCGDSKKNSSIECSNCGAKATPMWRKAPNGDLMCNACALYFKCHKRPRPVNCSRPAGNQLGGEPSYGYSFSGLMNECNNDGYQAWPGKVPVDHCGTASFIERIGAPVTVNDLKVELGGPVSFGKISKLDYHYPYQKITCADSNF